MPDASTSDFPIKLSHFFMYKNEVYPRGGVVREDKSNVVLLGATINYIVGLTQVYNDLAITKLTNVERIPLPPRIKIETVDDLLIYAYKTLFSPYYAEVIKGNKVVAVGVIYSKDVSDNRTTYWIYDTENNEIRKVDLIKVDNIIVNYVPIPEDEFNAIIHKIFNIEGAKAMLRYYIQHGLFTLDSYGE